MGVSYLIFKDLSLHIMLQRSKRIIWFTQDPTTSKVFLKSKSWFCSVSPGLSLCAKKVEGLINTSLLSQSFIYNNWYIWNNSCYLKTRFFNWNCELLFKTYLLSNILAVFHVMVSIRNDLWFNNGYQPILKRKKGRTKRCSAHCDPVLGKIFNSCKWYKMMPLWRSTI